MKLLQLATESFRGLRDGSYDLTVGGAPQPRVLVTGPSGAGLTTFLEAIAVASARMSTGAATPRDVDVVGAGKTTALLRTSWWLDEREQREGGLRQGTTVAEVVFRLGALGRVDADPALLAALSRYDHGGEASKVVYLPQRRVSEDTFSALTDFVAEQRRHQFSAEPTKFAGFARAIVHDAARPRGRQLFQRTQAIFDVLCDSAKLTRVGEVGLEFTSRAGARLPLAALSFSEKNAFVLAAAPALLGLGGAVVLLDMPEHGAPPDRLAAWLDLLAQASPDSQWIVATRSAALLRAAGPASVIDLGSAA